MPFFTMLMITAHDGNGKAIERAHTGRRCVEEAAETIPGFLYGETMLSTQDPGLVCVMCAWDDEAAYQQWLDSPVRARQTEDLAGLISADIKTDAFRSVHSVTKPAA